MRAAAPPTSRSCSCPSRARACTPAAASSSCASAAVRCAAATATRPRAWCRCRSAASSGRTARDVRPNPLTLDDARRRGGRARARRRRRCTRSRSPAASRCAQVGLPRRLARRRGATRPPGPARDGGHPAGAARRACCPCVAIVSLDFKCPSNTGERARWDEHEACLAARRRGGARGLREDAGRRGRPTRRGRARRAAGRRVPGPGAPLFLTPLTEPAGSAPADRPRRLERLHAAGEPAPPRRPGPAPAAQGPRHPVRCGRGAALTHRDSGAGVG